MSQKTYETLFDLWQLKSDGVEIFVTVKRGPQACKLCEVCNEVHFILCVETPHVSARGQAQSTALLLHKSQYDHVEVQNA